MDPRYSENSDYGYDRTGPYPCGDQKQYFNPQWLHQKLSENAEYRMLFADRIYKHLFNKGALTVDAVLTRFQAQGGRDRHGRHRGVGAVGRFQGRIRRAPRTTTGCRRWNG